jgi:dihydroorotate dehydrogenase electron transfer subunit
MKLEQGEIRSQEACGAHYRILTVATGAGATAQPGQFIHVRIPRLAGSVLRRPFSIYRADADHITILYKTVGVGTDALARLPAGEPVSLMGPLGNGFPEPGGDTIPVLVAGGYGVAPLWMLASRAPRTGILFVGAATAEDVLLVDAFKELGWSVEVATEDGSQGDTGLVTVSLDRWLETTTEAPEFFACGPDGMLKAVGDRAIQRDARAWLSLDKHMGCGVGACLACVQKVRKNGEEGWGRVCKDGPVFEAREIVW